MTADNVTPASPRAREGHNLPTLRVSRAWAAAEAVAEQHDVSRIAALDIAREVIAVIGEGTRRWGHLCTECRSLLVTKDGQVTCPEHGALGAFTSAVLLISFDPISSAT